MYLQLKSLAVEKQMNLKFGTHAPDELVRKERAWAGQRRQQVQKRQRI